MGSSGAPIHTSVVFQLRVMEVGAGPVVCVVDSLAEPAARFVYSSGKNLYALQLAGGSHTVQRLMGLEAAPGDLYATDLNADGMLDIFVRRGRSGGQLADLVLEGQAGGGYSQTAVLPIRDTCASSTQSCSLDLAVVSGVAFCDINTDGTIDIIESNRILLQVDQLYTESPLRVQGLPRVQTTSAVVCMDMNGDALPDVFIGGVGVPGHGSHQQAFSRPRLAELRSFAMRRLGSDADDCLCVRLRRRWNPRAAGGKGRWKGRDPEPPTVRQRQCHARGSACRATLPGQPRRASRGGRSVWSSQHQPKPAPNLLSLLTSSAAVGEAQADSSGSSWSRLLA